VHSAPPVQKVSIPLTRYKMRGNREWKPVAPMLFDLRALASGLLIPTAGFGAAVEPAAHLEKRAQPMGIDVSSHQGDVSWSTVVANGVSFAFIKATEGTSRGDSTLVVRNANVSFQPTRTLTSPPNILEPPTLVLFVAAITLPFPIALLVQLRPISSPPTVGAGVAMVSPSQAPSTLNVRITYFPDPLDLPAKHPPFIG